MLDTTLASRSKCLTYHVYFTASEKVLLKNFRLPSFTLPSKVQIQLLSCVKSNFASSSTFKHHTILFSSIMERFFTTTTFKDSQCHQDKNILPVDYLILQDSYLKSSFLETSSLEFLNLGINLK